MIRDRVRPQRDRAAAVARLVDGLIAAAGRRRWPLVRPRPASSAKVTSESGTSGSPRRTRARYSPVAEPFAAATCSGVPRAMIRPPRLPPSGPRSTIQSAVLMTSRLCSMTRTVLPLSTSRWRTWSSFSTSAKWRPVVGSSRTYSVRPVARRDSSVDELDPLGLAAGQGRGRLAEVDVAEPDVVERLQLAAHVRDRREEVERLGDRHLEDVRDRLALVVDLERLPVVALARADLARDVDVRQELHLDLEDAVALAVLAATALDVEAEAARRVAADARLRDAREQLADRREQPDVGRRVGARGPPDRALVDLDDLVDVLGPLERVVRADRFARAVQLAGEAPVEDLGDERALAAPRHAGDGHERPERAPRRRPAAGCARGRRGRPASCRSPCGGWPGSGRTARRAGTRR